MSLQATSASARLGYRVGGRGVGRLAVLVVVFVALGMFAARASADPFVYVANTGDVFKGDPGDDTVSEFDAGGAGEVLTPDSPPTVVSGVNPKGIAVSPDGRSVYVTNVNDGNGTVSQFDVDQEGALTPKNPAKVLDRRLAGGGGGVAG